MHCLFCCAPVPGDAPPCTPAGLEFDRGLVVSRLESADEGSPTAETVLARSERTRSEPER